MRQRAGLVVLVLWMLGSAQASADGGANAPTQCCVGCCENGDQAAAQPTRDDPPPCLSPPASVAVLPEQLKRSLAREDMTTLKKALTKLCANRESTFMFAEQTIKLLLEKEEEKEKEEKERTVESGLVALLAKVRAARPRVSMLEILGSARVAVHLANPPASRLRVSFDAMRGLHREAEWDPAVSSELTKEVQLPATGGKTEWLITTAFEPTSYAQSQSVVTVTVRFDTVTGACTSGQVLRMPGQYLAVSSKDADSAKAVSWSELPAPELTFHCTTELGTLDDERFKTPESESGIALTRSFGTAPSAVTETLSLLTEIAVERAKSGALRLLKKRFVDPICDGEGQHGQGRGGASLDFLGLGGESTPAFERTCGILEALRLEDVLSSGNALLAAVRADLVQTVLPSVIAHQAGKSDDGVGTTMARSLLSLAATAIDGDGVGESLLQATLTAVGQEATRLSLILSNALNGPCLVRTSVAVMKRCTRVPCDASEVSDMLLKPNSYFRVGGNCQRIESTPGQRAEAATLVLRGLKLLENDPSLHHRDRVKATITLVSKLLVLAGVKADDRLSQISEISVALVEEDYATALSRLLGWVRRDSKRKNPSQALGKLIRLVGAVAAYNQVVRATKDDEPETARKARKRALEALIDGATDRKGRDGEWITSIGSNVGVSLSQRTNRSDFEPGVRVPLGIAWEFTPPADYSVGARVGAQVVDLGQFVRRDPEGKLEDVQWQDFVSVGGEVSLLFGQSVNLSLHLSYAPSLSQGMDEKSGVWRFGLALGYYVPFFDLN